MGERRGTKALELWCKRITNGYPSVNVQNMTTSWRDGLAFCAMIHHFRPDLIDFSSLDKSDIYGNNELAFRTAEQHLGIPALLDAEDMASCSVPDRLSILTYLSQFYQVFGGSSSNRVALNSTSEKSSDRIKSISEAPQPKVSSRLGMRKDLCVSCDLPIFLAEKLMIARNAYHRNCFRCIRCHQQLTPGNYYETEDGQYRCEACPDDEVSTVILLEALSDEEKNKRRVFEREQQKVKEDDDNDNKFDEMIRMINDKIDELTSECEEQATSPNAMQKRDSRVNNASNVLECRRTSNNEDLETLKKRATPVLKKSDSLSAYEHIIKESRFVQRPLRLFEQAPILNMECEMESEPLSQVENHYVQKTRSISKNDYPENLNPFASNDKRTEVSSKLKLQEEKCSMNPFDCTDEVMPDETDQPSKLVLRLRSHKATEIPIKRLLEAPKINLNPFWSDDDRESSPDSELETKSKSPPVPKPRTLRYSDVDEDPLLYSKLNLTSIGIHSSNTSIASSCSTPGGTYRKKKPAPLPPPIQHQSYNTSSKSINITINSDLSLSPKLPFKMRKSKLAPAPPFPPTAASTPTRTLNWKNNTSDLLDESLDPRCSDNDVVKQHHLWNEEKLSKDEANRNTQNHLCSESSTYLIYPTNKSIEGKWKRKKGPAPPRPVPLRRKIKVMSMKDIKLELDQIEMQQQGLEKQGVRLEQIIRDKCESNTTSGEDINLGLDLEELILELFTLVNEKNELFRRQTELMLLRRQQRLEEEHADIEYEVRCLLTQPEATKTDFDKQREEILIQRLVEVVERRNEIVECLEMDRKREIEEDRSIHKEMDLYAVKSKSNIDLTDASRCLPKSKKGKIKGKKLKKTNKKDADKDVDETEAKLKRHNLRKWF